MFPTIRNNYLEQATGTFNCFFDITGGIEVRINDNRIEFNNNTSYTAIIRTDLMLLDMNRNTTKSGMSVGKGVQFVNPTYYGYSYFYWRKIIKHEQNTIERGFPYSYDASIPLNYAEIFNPSRGGLDSDSYGRSVLITDDAFVLAAVTPYSQTIRFNACLGRHIAFSLNNLAATIRNSNTGYSVGAVVAPSGGNGHLYVCIVAGTTGNTAPVFPLAEYATVTDGTVTWQELGKTLSGTFNVKIIAKATVPNQTLLCRAFNGATTQITSGNVIVANDQYKIYTVFSNVSAANLTLIFNNNNDTGNTGTIYIKEILVEYA
jgi:hypothetical protein